MTRIKKSIKNKKKKQKTSLNKKKKQKTSVKKVVCPNGLKKIKLKGETICVGRCPHSGGEIFYKPKIKKLECSLHQALFETNGKYISGPPEGQNLFVKKT
tara:strand:- start:572 stop:871 length:300 start_codon:yes stop_codon:yes gene_type:complete